MFLAIEAFPFRSVCLFPITNGWSDAEIGGCVLPFDVWCSSQARPCKELNFMRKRSTPSHDLSFHSQRMLTCFVGERCYSYLPSMLLCMIVARDSFFSLWILSKLLIWELSTICVVSEKMLIHLKMNRAPLERGNVCKISNVIMQHIFFQYGLG